MDMEHIKWLYSLQAKLTVELFGQRYCTGTLKLYEGSFYCIEQKFTEQVSCAMILYDVILEREL